VIAGSSRTEFQEDHYEGAWQRLVLSVPGEPVDTLTQVEWLQGPVFYVDVRQPVALAPQAMASCLAEVTLDEAALLAAQEGFAGRFCLAGNQAEWQREIDYRPCPLGDRGILEQSGDLLIETGVEADYIEYWQRGATGPDRSSGAARLLRADGCAVLLVRYGNRFGYARSRRSALPRGADLRSAVAAAITPQQAQALVDCEISLGTVTAQGWRIERSTLPWRAGDLLLGPDDALAQGCITVGDVDPSGRPCRHVLRLERLHGSLVPAPAEPAALPAPVAATAVSGAPFTAVPVVDIAALGGGDASAEAAAVAAVGHAASGVGFLHVTGHGIAPAVIERLQSAAKAFFALPLEARMACYIGNSPNHRGYVPEGEEALGEGKRDRKEAFDLALDLSPAETPAGHPMLGPNQWPDLAGFREDVMAYYAAVFAVGRRLLRGFALALGQPGDSLDHLVTTPPSQLRLIHYPHDAAAADAPGIGAHTDYECFTLLLATGPGLEVMNQAGDWIDAPPVPGALVVNIGDMMEYWSGGRFVATSHRVRKVAEERWSFPLFFALDYDVELRPQGQRDAPPIRTGEHLYAQTVQTFRYLKERAAAGLVALPGDARPVSSFGQEARHRDNQVFGNPA
jgi:isopenicillin N synthase-like dioxygenase